MPSAIAGGAARTGLVAGPYAHVSGLGSKRYPVTTPSVSESTPIGPSQRGVCSDLGRPTGSADARPGPH